MLAYHVVYYNDNDMCLLDKVGDKEEGKYKDEVVETVNDGCFNMLERLLSMWPIMLEISSPY